MINCYMNIVFIDMMSLISLYLSFNGSISFKIIPLSLSSYLFLSLSIHISLYLSLSLSPVALRTMVVGRKGSVPAVPVSRLRALAPSSSVHI